MLYLALGILLIALIFFSAPIVGPHLTDIPLIKKCPIVLTGIALLAIGVFMIDKGVSGMVITMNKLLFEVIFVAVVVFVALFANWLIRTIARAIYDKGFREAETAYCRTTDDLRKDVARLHQFLAEKGIELPADFYDYDDENSEVNDE